MKNSNVIPVFLLYASFCLFFCVLSLDSTSQSHKFDSKTEVYNNITTKNSDKSFLKTRADSLDYQIFLTRYCLNLFRQEQYIAMGVELSGGLVIALAEVLVGPEPHNYYNGTNQAERMYAESRYYNAVQNRNKDIRNCRLIGGGVLFAGGILHIASYRWLRKAYIQPSKEGIGIIVNF